MSAAGKGAGFELELSALFEQRGYEVRHNARMEGRSGAVHQVDVYASYGAPLHTSTVVVEAKDHRSNIDKDAVMKLAAIRDDLSAGHAVLAATSGFTPGALKTAAMDGNIDLWDGPKTAALLADARLPAERGPAALPLAVQAAVSPERARAWFESVAAKRSKGGFLGRGKIPEKVAAVRTVWHPYYDVEMDASVQAVEKTGWRSKETTTQTVRIRVAFDAVSGALVSAGPRGLSYRYAALAEIDGAQRALLRGLGAGQIEKRSAALPGVSAAKAGQMINDMAAKGLLVQTRARPAAYRAAGPYPRDPSVLGSIGGTREVSRADVGQAGGEPLEMGAVGDLACTYWSGVRVNSVERVYYPYYVATVERGGGARRSLCMDAATGARCRYFEG